MVEDERFFADRIGADAEGESHMSIVKIIGGADAGVVNALVPPLSAQLFRMPVEPLKLGEEGHFVKEAVEDSHRIGLVQRGDDPVPGIPDRFHVARCDISGGTYKSKIPWRGHIIHCSFLSKSQKVARKLFIIFSTAMLERAANA